MIPPREHFRAPVDDGARLLLVLLWTYAAPDDEHAFVWPTIATLAEVLGVPERTVYRRLATLRRAGLVRRCRQARRWSDRTWSFHGWSLRAVEGGEAIDPDADVRLPPIEETPHPDDEGDDPVTRGTGNPDAGDSRIPVGKAIEQATGKGDEPPRTRGAHDELVAGVLEAMRSACNELHGRGGCGPDDCEGNRTLILRCCKVVRRKGQTDAELLADWQRVIARQLDNVRRDRSKWRYLSLSTLCRTANYLRIRDAPEGRARTNRWAPSDWDDVPG